MKVNVRYIDNMKTYLIKNHPNDIIEIIDDNYFILDRLKTRDLYEF